MRFELEDSLRGVANEDLLDELRRCAKHLGRETITISEFEQYGKCHPCTIQRRFGSWTKALNLAGLQPSRSKIGIASEELFQNIQMLWTTLGRQPRYDEVRSPSSKYSAGTYEKRFGSWTNSLREFIRWVNSDDAQDLSGSDSIKSDVQSEVLSPRNVEPKRRTRREITDRQRFRILCRDGFRCRACGASPFTQLGVELQVDHVVPWSKGGETTDDNLQCKCSTCNFGKGNAFDV